MFVLKENRMENIETELKNLMAKHLRCEVEKLNDEADIISDLGADSLDTVEMVMEIEEKYGLEISDSDAASKMKTVGDVIKYVKEHAKC